MTSSAPRAPRSYNSPIRDESARRTRTRILTAAQGLFLERGFAGTPIADIARSAGVSRPTVLTVFGTKAALLRAVVDVAMAGEDGDVPVAQQPWFLPVWEATTPQECLDAYARACVRIGRRSAAVIELVRRASDQGPDIREQWDSLQSNRRYGAATIARQVRTLGPLASGVTLARATDLIWMYNDSAHYTTLVTACGWSEKAFERWLAAQMRGALLG